MKIFLVALLPPDNTCRATIDIDLNDLSQPTVLTHQTLSTKGGLALPGLRTWLPGRRAHPVPTIHRGARRSSPAFNEMFSRSEEDTHGTCSPSVAREMPMRARLNTSSRVTAGLRASLMSSVMNRLFFP